MTTMAQSTGSPLVLGEDDPTDAVGALHRAAAHHPGHGTATVDGLTTYPELLLRARELLTGLRAHGLRPGDPVVLHGLPLADFFPSFWACVLGGLVPVAIAEPWTPDAPTERLAHVCRLLGGPVVLTGAEAVAPLRALATTVAEFGPAAVMGVDNCAGEPATDLHTPAPDDVAVLILSSGSTGMPKAVRLTHHALALGAASFARAMDLRSDHVTLNWLPVDHSGALILYHINEVFAGATNVHVATDTVLGNPLRWLDLLAEHRVNHSWAPMFGYQLVTDALADHSGQWDLAAVRTLLCGGEQVMPRAVTDFLAATGIRADVLVPAWGMAETTSAVTFGRFTTPGTVLHIAKASLSGDLDLVDETTDERDRVTFVAAGAPGPGVTVRVVDHDGVLLPEHRIGRLQVSADRLMAGYLDNPEADRAVFPAGRTWLDSGDLAFLSDGHVVITGRAKDIIILNGHNHFCHDIEDVVRATGLGAAGVAACGVPDQATGTEQLVVFVVTDDPDPADERVVREALFARLRLGRARVIFLPAAEFPRTPSGKVRRAELRDRLVAGRYDPAPDLTSRVQEIVSAVLGHDADQHTPFYELGMTSVSLARTRARLTDELGITIAPTALFRYPTVAELAAHLSAAPAAVVSALPTPVADRRVAIIGMAIRFPGASTLDEYWANLSGGVDSVQTFTTDDPDIRPVGGTITDVDGFDEAFFGVSPREAALTDPAHRVFLECTHHALEHAGYAGQERGYRVGVFAGSGMNLYGHQDTPTAPDTADALAATIGSEPDFLATRVAYRLGLTGPAIGVQTACSTSLVAVHLAAQAVLNGDADIAVAGAAAVRVPQEAGYRYEPGSILSPTGQCRAFDTSADGTVGGNGVAAVVLKPLAAALADGDPVHAVILGSAVNNDGRGKVGFTAPSAPGQVAVIQQALARAGVAADTISYVEAHGTGTELGDAVEVEALREAFGPGRRWLGSVKPNVGHLDSCAGMAGLVKVVLMLRNRVLAPTINVTTPAASGEFELVTARREWTVEGVRRAGVSAFGVGGTNAHVVVEEAPPVTVPSLPSRAVLVPVSATSSSALAASVSQLQDHLSANPSLRMADVANTLAVGRRHLPVREAAVGSSAADLAFLDGPVEPLGPLVFAFSGQGVPGLAEGLSEAFPVVREVLEEGKGRGPQAEAFALQAALVELWRSVGVTPDYVTGHSLGEYAALYSAGALSLADGLRLTTARGEVLRGQEPGGMLAVNAEAPAVARLAATSGTSVAAVNGTFAHTLSGPVAAIEHAAALAAAEGIACRRLDVTEAFHSALVEPALPELRHHAERVAWRPLAVPFISGLDGRVLPAGTAFDVDLLCRQAREPVRFDQVLATVDNQGCRDVVEIGPGKVLSAFGRRALPDSTWLPTMGPAEPTEFLTAVGELYRRGKDINWPALTVEGARRIPLPQYPFTRTTHTSPLTAQTSPSAASPDKAVTVVSALTAQLLGMPSGSVDPDRTFIALGADSLSLMTMVRDLAADYDTTIPVRQLFTETDTPRKLAALITLPEQPAPTPQPELAEPAPQPTPALPTPHPEPPSRPEPAATPPTALLTVVEQQLALAHQMVDRLTTMMSDQLTALTTNHPAATATPLTPLAPTPASPAPTTPPPAPLAAVSSPPTSPPAAPQAPTSLAPAPPAPTPPAVPATVAAAHPAPPIGSGAVCDFSLYFFGDYPDESHADKYHLITEAATFADQHGFHALWLPERHFHSFGALFPNPSVLAAALATRTNQIRLHAGSVVLPLHHPVRVAEEWSVVDNLSHGRAGLCVASGWHATDFVLAPQNFGQHRDLMYTHLDTVRRLWAGESVTAVDGTGEPTEVRLHPKPIQDQPPMYVAVVGNPDSYRLAARHDLGVVTNLMAQDVDQLTANIALYRRTRAEHGLDPAAGRIVVLVHTFLGEDLDTVRQQAFRPFCDYLRSSLSLFDQVTNSLGIDIDLEATTDDDVEFLLERAYARYCESRALIGTVVSSRSVVDRLVAAGADEIACFVDFGVPADHVLNGLSTLDTLRKSYTGQELTAAEQRIWFLDRLYPGQTIYHEPKAIRLDGPLDVTELQAALRRVVDRQPALRTVFPDDDGVPRRVVLPHVDLDCPVVDRTGSTEDDVLHDARAAIEHEVFDLAAGPLLSARLYRLAADRHLLFLNAHHIVFDSTSTAVLLADLAAYYRGQSLPALPARAEPTSTKDAEDVERWRAHFADAPVLRLPTDHPRPQVRSGRGAPWTHDLPADLTDQLTALGRRHGVTPFMTLLGAIAAVLGRFARQDDFVLGTAVANRPLGTEDRIGLFLDTVALRMDLSGDPTFTDLATRIRETTAAAYGQPPFDELVRALNPERDAGGNPLFQVMVEYENAADVEFAPPVTATALDVPANRAPFDLALYLTRHPGGVRIGVEYDTDLFTQDTVVRLLTLVEATLRRAVTTPDAVLSTLTAPTDADRTALAGWQGGAATDHACLHELVECQVDRTPDATALVAGMLALSYRDLDDAANRVAARLGAEGIGRGDLVGACMPRGPELIVTLLGVLKTGAAYLPLDPSLPAGRLDHLIEDSGARLVLRAFPDGLDTAPTTRPDVRVDPADPAYCIYTSGSTGRPKGVLVPHRGPANTVAWQARQHRPLRTLQWTSPSFDVSVQEIFSTLAAGATLVLVDDDVRYDPAEVASTIREHRVERIFMPYTPLKYLLETAPSLPSLRMVVSAGEAMVLTPPVRRFFAEHPNCLLYNQYGPTEGSIIVTSQEVDPAGEAIPPIGAPIDGVTVAVLDERREPVPVGAIGVLHIGGIAVATGYLGRQEETAAAFVDGRYRTGDLGRWRADGTIEFLGRCDDQVKIRGYRVEPGESRRAVAELAGVRDSAVIVGRDPAGEPELVAYVVSDTAVDLLADQLRTTLPGYLVPTKWVAVDRLPFTANGKLDVSRLPAPPAPALATRPVTPVEETLHELWCAELGNTTVPVDASFFALGGHSLSAVRLLNRVTTRLGLECSMATFFAHPTIRALAMHLDATPVVDTAPLTGQQTRLWRRHHELSDPAVYNVSHRVDLRGPLDAAALAAAVTEFVRRHAALRTRVVELDGELAQEVLAPFPLDLPTTDLTGADVDRWCQDAADEPFRLDEAPLFRVRLGRQGTDRWVLVLVMHHMVCDGWSLGVMWDELSALYAGEVLPPAPQYPEYVRWERGHVAGLRRAQLERFWRKELAGADLRLRLPADRPRPPALSGRGALHESDLGPTLAARVRTAAVQAGSTPYAVLAAAFARWGARRCGQDEVVLPTSTANRVRPEHERVVGMIGDVVLVRVRPHDPDVVRQVAGRLYAALDHQELRLASVVDLMGAGFPNFLFTVVTTPPPALDLPGVTATVGELAVPGTARNELYVRVVLDDNRIRVCWECSTDLFDASTVAEWASELETVLTDLTTEARRAA